MIRINLLPVKAAQKKQQLQGQLIVAGITLLATGALCALAYLQLLIWTQEAADAVGSKKVEITRLMKTIGEVNEYKKRQEDLQAKLDILDKLEKSRSGPVLVLDELYLALPDKVWLESFKEGSGKANITGMGINEETVALFMRNLENSPQFAGVALKVVQQVVKDGVKFQKFDIECTLEKQQQINLEAAGAQQHRSGKTPKAKTPKKT
jgi:type IV pilus assembly protein PilN